MGRVVSSHVRTSYGYKREQGQILLVVVLLMVVVLTIGISLASRSIMNIRQVNESDSSQRAFSAAEAGIRVAQETGNDVSTTTFTDATTYSADVRTVSSQQMHVKNGSPLLRDEGNDIWLSSYPTFSNKWSGALSLYWGSNADGCLNAAIEIAVLSGNQASPRFDHFAYDPCGSRATTNHFSSVSTASYSIGGKTFRHRVTLPTITNGILMRIIPLYTSTPAYVSTGTGSPLPPQGEVIESTGSSGGTQRKIVLVRGNPKLPLEMFPYVLFTPQ